MAPTDPISPSGTWSDLRERVVYGALIAVIGIGAVWAGGVWIESLAVLAAGLMVWELAAMLAPNARPSQLVLAGVLGAAAVSAQFTLDSFEALALLLAPALLLAAIAERDRVVALVYGMAILLSAWGLAVLRTELGLGWIIGLVAIVVASDVLGYFAGRMIGGPKFWPKVSPKKTWSGTLAGWVGAAMLGVVFVIASDAGPALIVFSVLACFAGQLGDIAESAIKRRAGIKDSSDLIPGHGGLLDRFDAMMGATLFLLAASVVASVTDIAL